MEQTQSDIDLALMLDGNAAAGILHEIFALEVTDCMTECAHCGMEGEIGSLLAFIQAPGIVLRCPVCRNIILRIVQTPQTVYLDLRGAVYVGLKRETVVVG